jgi:carboxypeptidase T
MARRVPKSGKARAAGEPKSPLYHVRIFGFGVAQMADLVRVHRVPVARGSVARLRRDGYSVDAHLSPDRVRRLERAGFRVERRESWDSEARARRQEFRKALAARRRAHASGKPITDAMRGYLSVDEVESALAAMAAPPHDGFTQLITLPHETWQRRTCHALRIGRGGGLGRPGVYLISGVHAREWGGPDILISFAAQLVQAYHQRRDLSIGGARFSASAIRKAVEDKDIFVFPQVNPDGRFLSMTRKPMWRKNMRPAPPGMGGCVGVDVNRNYDFLWDFTRFFDPAAAIKNSTDPCDVEDYVGPTALSEPETQNVRWMLDQFPGIRFFADLHSYGEKILYPWMDDQNQGTDPSMNFGNASFDHKRGIPDDNAYREYLPAKDQQLYARLATGMSGAIKSVRGREYGVEPAFKLYCAAGTSVDYVFSRHLADSTRPRVVSFGIEWGSKDNHTPFHPPYSEMAEIIREVTAGLFNLCLNTA